MGMIFAWLFIAAAWTVSFSIWAWPMAADWPPERVTGFTILWRSLQVLPVCMGSLFVPDLWL